MDIGTAGERVADAPADAGGRAAEGLDLGGMVMRFILEHQKPVLLLAVHHGGHMDGAGVDLLALVELEEQPAGFERLCADGRNIHERLRALGSPLRAVDLLARSKIARIGTLDGVIIDTDLVKVCGEGRVAAVVGPVGVDHAQLGHGGVAALGLAEIVLQRLEVGDIHGKPHGGEQCGERGLVHDGEALDGRNALRLGKLLGERFGLCKARLAAFDGVDDITLDRLDIGIRQRPIERVDLRRADAWALALAQKLDALRRAVRALVELTGQGLDGKDRAGVLRVRRVGHKVQRRLGKHAPAGIFKERGLDPLYIIAVPDTRGAQALHAEKITAVRQQRLALGRETLPLFHIGPKYHFILSPPAPRARRCRCRRGSICWQNLRPLPDGTRPRRRPSVWGRRR